LKVIKVPRPEQPYETYVNSLYVNGTLFLPTFQESGDTEAVALYESFGYKVISLDSKELSNQGLGSIHCITMAYPPVPFNELLANVGGREVTP
jgi:agmatine/peptidylarginine deiminase